jgi:lipid II:glycine glycyltransferase (peptidoglycan interpeptide bridge formation enzyme)
MPLPVSRRLGKRTISMPPLTQTLGVLLGPPTSEKYEARLSKEMEMVSALIEAIPKFSYFSARFHHTFTNWLPLYWAGFAQTTRYTYAIEDLTDLDKVFSDFAHSKRKNIKKAENLVRVDNDLPPEDFYANHALTLRKQGEDISYTYDLFQRLYKAAIENNAGRIWQATDAKGNIHAAIFVVFDTKSAYYLISTIDPDYRNSGAATLLLRDAIAYVAQYTNRFDFEGSMIRGVENSFRKCGAIQVPYFSITKDNRSWPTKFGIGLFRLAKGTLRRTGLK